MVSIDPEEQEQERRRMLTYLGRYGRQSTFEADWWDVDVEELKARFQDLSEVIRQESSTTQQGEDKSG